MEKNGYKIENYELDNCEVRIFDTDLATWWTIQQIFAEPPFEEFFDTPKLKEYYQEFKDGGIYHLGIKIDEGLFGPAGLISWHPIVPGTHPVKFDENEKVAYISDAATFSAYRKKGVQKHLFEYALNQMKNAGYTKVYLRTSPQSKMSKAAEKMGFSLIENVYQNVTSMRVTGMEDSDIRIFFVKDLI